jgi:hypothetical protein
LYSSFVRPPSLGLALLLVGCAGQPHVAPTRASGERPAAAAALPGIVVRPEAGGIRVTYRSVAPARAFGFDHGGAEIRADTWKLLGEGLSFSPDGVASTTPVTTFDIAIAPDSKQRDRVYPALSRVGGGWLIYAPHLQLDDTVTAGRLSIEVPAGWSVVGHRDEKGELVGDGYIFAGPSAYVRRGAVDVVSAPSSPEWLLRMIEQYADGAVDFYSRRLGAPLGVHATIVVDVEPEREGSYHGDTTPGAMVSLRFFGARWSERGTAATGSVSDFLDHELFHLWNAEVARTAEGATRPWLHEGGANYAALLLGRERGTMSEDGYVANLNRHLERCQRALPELDLRDRGPKRGGAVYACGTVLQWAIDIGLRKVSNGQRDALTWWRDVLAKADGEGRTYSFDGAYALVGPDASKAADALLGAGSWAVFADAARGYGVDLALSRLPAEDMVDALDHLLEIHCGHDRGFFTFADHVELDAHMHCGPIDGVRDVDSIAGFDVVAQASAMNDAVRKLCASGKPVEFGWKGKVVARVPCTKPLAPATLGWQLRPPAAGASSGREQR